MTAMKNQGLVSETKRVDPNTGRNRSGYEPTESFKSMVLGISPLIGEYESKLVVDVSEAPLVNGVSVGDYANVQKVHH